MGSHARHVAEGIATAQGYNLVRTHDGTGAFVIVDHDEEDAIQAGAPISNIYAAGANATLYTLSLRRNYRRGFITDFSRVEGLPGVFAPWEPFPC